jgi:hypothetical protein
MQMMMLMMLMRQGKRDGRDGMERKTNWQAAAITEATIRHQHTHIYTPSIRVSYKSWGCWTLVLSFCIIGLLVRFRSLDNG